MTRNSTRRRTPLLILAGATVLSVAAGPAFATTPRPPVLNAAAQRAGLQAGNATMGWRSGAAARSGEVVLPLSKAYTPTGVLGVDVSGYQKNFTFSTWKAKGRTFAYIKATEGTSYRNPYFKTQYASSLKAGMIRGAYHFASPNGKSGKTQAAYFVKHGGGWTEDGRTLPGVLDIEYNPYGSTCYGLSKTKMVKWIKSFTTEYKRQTTRDAVIYSTTDWWTRCTGNTKAFTTTNPLWIARYGTSSPGKLPGSWKWATFWQYTSSPVDQNRFSSSKARLVVLANGHEPDA